jgi:hypothetical protein
MDTLAISSENGAVGTPVPKGHSVCFELGGGCPNHTTEHKPHSQDDKFHFPLRVEGNKSQVIAITSVPFIHQQVINL